MKDIGLSCKNNVLNEPEEENQGEQHDTAMVEDPEEDGAQERPIHSIGEPADPINTRPVKN